MPPKKTRRSLRRKNSKIKNARKRFLPRERRKNRHKNFDGDDEDDLDDGKEHKKDFISEKMQDLSHFVQGHLS